jgi:serine/threonine-protein phosphatase 2A activator
MQLQLETEYSSPKSIHQEFALLEQEKDRLLYFGCIQYIKSLKTGVPFFESSPMLNDISQTLPTWQKVSSGLLKLYEGEVLKKRQVVQHFVFGNIFKANWTPSQENEQEAPTATFRTPVAPMVRAPWATEAPPMPSSKAPWAK